MTERELQQTLHETSSFSQRQRLLKQIWKLRRQGVVKPQSEGQVPPRGSLARATVSQAK